MAAKKPAARRSFRAFFPSLFPRSHPSPPCATLRRCAVRVRIPSSRASRRVKPSNPPMVRQKSTSVLNTGCGASAPTLVASFLTASSSESIRDCCCSSNASFSSARGRPLRAFVDSLLSWSGLLPTGVYSYAPRAQHARGFVFNLQSDSFLLVMRNHVTTTKQDAFGRRAQV